jgi:hypothetical protein
MNTTKTAVAGRLLQLSLVLMLTMNALSAFAMPTFARQYKHQYGYIPSCHACHQEGGGTPLNEYGQAFKGEGKNSAAFELIAAIDSDKDGFTNELEATKKSNPGDTNSTPSSQGDWLDLSSLIPKEVQNLFPDATAWKPLDAILTDKDIARAKSLGVTLSAEDENTIYIPVAKRRPIGTALIFPVIHKGETFFLLMATDRQLNISQVSLLKTDKSPEKISSELFKEFVGSPLQSVSSGDGQSLVNSIRLAVKRAGVLVYMRLKGA